MWHHWAQGCCSVRFDCSSPTQRLVELVFMELELLVGDGSGVHPPSVALNASGWRLRQGMLSAILSWSPQLLDDIVARSSM